MSFFPMQLQQSNRRLEESAGLAQPNRRALTGYLVVVAIAILMFAYTWGHWGSLHIDAGRELWVPTQIAAGKLLYRDLWYPYGPLLPYLQAAVVAVFGSSLSVYYVMGCALLMTGCLGLYSIARRFLPAWAALLAPVFLLFEGLHPHLMNYVLPYSYAAAFAAVGGIWAAACALEYMERPSRGWLLMASLCCGLATAAKQEFAPLFLPLVVLSFWRHRGTQGGTRAGWPDLVLPWCAGFAVALAGYAFFAWRVSPRTLFFDNFQSFPGSYFAQSYGALWTRQWGIDPDPKLLLSQFRRITVALAVWSALAFGFRSHPKSWRFAATATLACAALGLAAVDPGARTRLLYMVFPSASFWIAVGMLLWFAVAHRRSDTLSVWIPRVIGSFAIAAGFRVLTRPSTVPSYSIFYNPLVFVAFLWLLARLAAAVAGTPRLRTWVAAGVFAAEFAGLAILWFPNPRHYAQPVETPRGTLYSYAAVDARYGDMVSFVQQQAQAGHSFVVLPEDVTLYYLTRTEPPSRWYTLTPGVLRPEQEQAYIADLERAGVDYILITNRSYYEFGLPSFGLDYNQTIYRWLQDHYEVTAEIGHFERYENAPFAAQVWRRKARAGSLV